MEVFNIVKTYINGDSHLLLIFQDLHGESMYSDQTIIDTNPTF